MSRRRHGLKAICFFFSKNAYFRPQQYTQIKNKSPYNHTNRFRQTSAANTVCTLYMLGNLLGSPGHKIKILVLYRVLFKSRKRETPDSAG